MKGNGIDEEKERINERRKEKDEIDVETKKKGNEGRRDNS